MKAKHPIIDTIQGNEAAIKASGIKSLYLFGSYVKNKARQDSDVDLFFDYEDPSFSLIDMLDVKQKLSDLLQKDVDLMSRDSLHPALKDQILSEAVQVF